MKQQIIAELKQEIHRMEVSSQPHEFDKHLYAVERLVELLKKDSGKNMDLPAVHKPHEQTNAMSEQDREMLQMMGGKVTKSPEAPRQTNGLPAEMLETDDGFGNGDSLFEF